MSATPHIDVAIHVVTFADCQLNAVTVDPVGIVSDHALVVCRLITTPTTAERLVRGWR